MFQCLRFGEALVVVVLSNTPQTISDFSFEHWRYGQDTGHGFGIGSHHLFELLKLAERHFLKPISFFKPIK